MADYITTHASPADDVAVHTSGIDAAEPNPSTDQSRDEDPLLEGATTVPFPAAGGAPSGAEASIGSATCTEIGQAQMHSELRFPDKHTCAVKDCLRVFDNSSKLQQHASKTGHKSFQCQCNKGYTKLCSLTRHIKEAVEKPHYKCALCEPWRSTSSFPPYVRCNSNLGRISHLETHLRKIHELKHEEIEAIVRPLRKRKPGVTSPEASTPAAAAPAPAAPAAVIAVSGDDSASLPSIQAVLGRSDGVSPVGKASLPPFQSGILAPAPTQAGPNGMLTGTDILPTSLAAYQLAPGPLPFPNGAPLVTAYSRQSGTGYFDPTVSGLSAIPAGGLPTSQDPFGYHNAALDGADSLAYAITPTGHAAANPFIQPATFCGYGPIGPGGMAAPQIAFFGSPAGVNPGNQVGYTAAPGGIFPAYPPVQPAPLFGYDAAAHGGMFAFAQHGAFSGLPARHAAANPAGFSATAALNNNFGVSTAEYSTIDAGVLGQDFAAMPSNSAGPEAVFDLVGDDIEGNFSNLGGLDFNNAGF